nr:MAG TPA: hypothetical protein [Caudoviricetes sp.]
MELFDYYYVLTVIAYLAQHQVNRTYLNNNRSV